MPICSKEMGILLFWISTQPATSATRPHPFRSSEIEADGFTLQVQKTVVYST